MGKRGMRQQAVYQSGILDPAHECPVARRHAKGGIGATLQEEWAGEAGLCVADDRRAATSTPSSWRQCSGHTPIHRLDQRGAAIVSVDTTPHSLSTAPCGCERLPASQARGKTLPHVTHKTPPPSWKRHLSAASPFGSESHDDSI